MKKNQEAKFIISKNLCLLCKNSTNGRKLLLLCKNCVNNPFLVEDLRSLLAKSQEYNLLMATYSDEYAQIKNINSQKFWNQKFDSQLKLKDQDSMTKEKINTLISLLPNKLQTILDLGIGQAYFEDRLKELGLSYKLYGIDISSLAIERVKSNFEGEFAVADIFIIDTLYKHNFFDVIVALELVEHISSIKIFSLLKKINLILKKDGVLIISTPLNEGLRNKNKNPSGHVRDYTIPILESELMLSGFDVVEKKTFYAFQNFYRLKKFLSKLFPHHWQPNNVVIKAVKG